MVCGDVEWINLALDMEQSCSLVNIVMNHRIPQKQGNSLNIRATSSFLRVAPIICLDSQYHNLVVTKTRCKCSFMELKYLLDSGKKRIIQTPEPSISIIVLVLNLESGWSQRV